MAHPIHDLMITAMQSIKEMVDVNTIVGDAVTTPDGMVIIPISKVAFGFASGGGEYDCVGLQDREPNPSDTGMTNLPFAGGSGAGISINPVAFMVVGQGQMKLMTINSNTSLDRIIDMAPEFLEKMNEWSEKKKKDKA